MSAGGSGGSGGGCGGGGDGGGGGEGTSAPSARSSGQSYLERLLHFYWKEEHRYNIMQEIIAAARQLQKSVKARQSEALVADAQASLDAARERMRAAKDEAFRLDADYVAEMRLKYEAEGGFAIFLRHARNWLLLLVRKKRRIAAALSLHPKVGKGSGLGKPNEDNLQFILDMSLPFIEAGRNLHGGGGGGSREGASVKSDPILTRLMCHWAAGTTASGSRGGGGGGGGEGGPTPGGPADRTRASSARARSDGLDFSRADAQGDAKGHAARLVAGFVMGRAEITRLRRIMELEHLSSEYGGSAETAIGGGNTALHVKLL